MIFATMISLGSAAFLLGVPQDWRLLFSGIAVPLIVVRDLGRGRRPTAITA